MQRAWPVQGSSSSSSSSIIIGAIISIPIHIATALQFNKNLQGGGGGGGGGGSTIVASVDSFQNKKTRDGNTRVSQQWDAKVPFVRRTLQQTSLLPLGPDWTRDLDRAPSARGAEERREE